MVIGERKFKNIKREKMENIPKIKENLQLIKNYKKI